MVHAKRKALSPEALLINYKVEGYEDYFLGHGKLMVPTK